jgi:hypothetical protein
MQFTQLSAGKTGKPVLIPKSARITSINASDDEADTFWLEYIWHEASDGTPSTRASLVQGPIETILEALNAQTTASDKTLLAQLAEARARMEATEQALQQLRAAEKRQAQKQADYAREIEQKLALYMTVDTESKWMDVPSMGTSTLYTSVRLKVSNGGAWHYLFRTGRGNVGAGFTSPLTSAHTNLTEPGRVPNHQPFLAYGVCVEIFDCSDTLAAWLKARCALYWDVAQNNEPLAPIGTFQWDPQRDHLRHVGRLRLDGRTDERPNIVPAHEVNARGREAAYAGERNEPSYLNLQPDGVHIPGHGTFGMNLFVSAILASEHQELVGEEATLRISLAGYYLPNGVVIGDKP